MAATIYPVFAGGQTLTARDLNQVRAFLHDRDRLLGRLIGFGVNCGLGGTVSGSTLTIAPGLAVDQVGEPLLLGAAARITLPPSPAGAAFDFIATGPGGFSVVLESTDTVEPVPDCGEAGCEGHAEPHVRSVALTVVPGRVTGTRFDFGNETLLTVEPLRLSVDGNPQGAFVGLRNAIVSRLQNGGSPLISGTLISQLQGMSIGSSDLPGVKGYKAGFLNQVLFAALDLLRCRALSAVPCDRSTTRPGVVLGWVHQVGGSWVWDCGYRHRWEPPVGFSQASLGGTCSDACGLYTDRLEGLISGYAPPDPPPPQPGGGGGTTVDPGIFVFCPQGTVLVGGRCVNILLPPPEIPEYWIKPWVEWPPNPGDPYPFPDLTTQPWEVYGTDPWTYFGEGVLSVMPGLGYDAGAVRTQLGNKITELGGTPNIVITTVGELGSVEGYSPAGGINIADTVVLTADDNGRVIGTGRIAAAHTARKLGTELPAAVGKADQALGATAELSASVAGLGDDLTGLHTEFAGFQRFQQDTGAWRGQVTATLGSLGDLVQKTVDESFGVRFDSVQERLAVAEGSLDVLKLIGGRSPGPVRGLDAGAAGQVAKFAETTIEAMRSLEGRGTPALTGAVAAAEEATRGLREIVDGGDEAAIGTAVVGLLDTVRTMVKASGVDASLGRQLDSQFSEVRGRFG
jgi:hypothetical protein